MSPRACRPLRERFEAFVHHEPNTGCHLWAGGISRGGYGLVRLGRASCGQGLSHRVAWELYRGKIPDGLNVLHRCDNPPCVNPDHLFLGTFSDNTTDMARKGRGRKSATMPYGVKARVSGVFFGYVYDGRKQTPVGTFPTVEAAAVAVREKKMRLLSAKLLARKATQ